MISTRYTRFSINSLKSTNIATLLESLDRRFHLQRGTLRAIAKKGTEGKSRRSLQVLEYLLDDTIKRIAMLKNMENAGSVNQEGIIADLDARHGLSIETFVEFMRENQSASSQGIEYLQRQVGCNVLLSHLVSLTSKRYFRATGAVDVNMDVEKICLDAKVTATSLVEHHYNICPDIIVKKSKNVSHMVGIPSLLRFSIIELLKNACQATLEQYCHKTAVSLESFQSTNLLELEDLQSKGNFLSPIEVSIEQTDEGITTSVIDQGTGFALSKGEIPMHTMKDALFSSNALRTQARDVDQQASYQPKTPPLAGLGVGLTLSRLFSQLHGGDVIISSHGKGRGATCSIKIPSNVDILETVLEQDHTTHH